MAYQINKTSGALLVNLADGQIDTLSTDITLIGKNYTGFGESINENFVKMLENFANASSPPNPLAGQIWWDTSNSRLKVYTGTDWTTGGGPIVQPTQPTMVAGDMWINNDANQLYFFDGTDLELAGPIYNAFQGRSGPEVVTVLDNTGTSRTIVKYWVGGTFVGLWSKIGFTPQNVDTIPGFTGDVVKGFNVVDSDFIFAGTASRTSALVDSNNVSRTAATVHFERWLYYARELYLKKKAAIALVPTDKMRADDKTKVVHKSKFEYCRKYQLNLKNDAV